MLMSIEALMPCQQRRKRRFCARIRALGHRTADRLVTHVPTVVTVGFLRAGGGRVTDHGANRECTGLTRRATGLRRAGRAHVLPVGYVLGRAFSAAAGQRETSAGSQRPYDCPDPVAVPDGNQTAAPHTLSSGSPPSGLVRRRQSQPITRTTHHAHNPSPVAPGGTTR